MTAKHFNFRNTVGGATDQAGFTVVTPADAGSTVTRAGSTFTLSSAPFGGRDVSGVVSPSLAGDIYVSSADGGTFDFTPVLDAPGAYHVNLGVGLPDEALGPLTISIYDGATLLWAITGGPNPGQVMDATGTLWPSANMWKNQQRAHGVTFAGTTCRVHLTVPSGRGGISTFSLDPVVPATQMEVAVPPQGIRTGAAFRVQPVVHMLDGLNRLVFTDTRNVTASLNVLTGAGTLAGTTTVACVGGVATFPNLQVVGGQSGTARLTFSDGTLSVTSDVFTFGPAATCVVTVFSTAGTVGIVLTTSALTLASGDAGVSVTGRAVDQFGVTTPDPVYIYSRDRAVVQAAPTTGVLRYIGLPGDVGTLYGSLIPPPDWELVDEVNETMLEQGHLGNFESAFWFDAGRTMIIDDPTGLFGGKVVQVQHTIGSGHADDNNNVELPTNHVTILFKDYDIRMEWQFAHLADVTIGVPYGRKLDYARERGVFDRSNLPNVPQWDIGVLGEIGGFVNFEALWDATDGVNARRFASRFGNVGAYTTMTAYHVKHDFGTDTFWGTNDGRARVEWNGVEAFNWTDMSLSDRDYSPKGNLLGRGYDTFSFVDQLGQGSGPPYGPEHTVMKFCKLWKKRLK